MDLIDKLREIAAKIPKLKTDGLIKTEEGTKNALIMPFINALGYDVFNPLEVTPELVADVGIKKGEKVDYAILQDGKPIILFECKSFGADLKLVHASQLYRYFSVTAARFGVLTDGVIYRFYTDLDAPNKMDDAPFFIFDMMNIKEIHVEELKRFAKSFFDETAIINTAAELRYKNAIKVYLEEQLERPKDEFVKFIAQASHAYTGRFSSSFMEAYTPVTREALRSFISDQVEKRLKSALATEMPETPPTIEPETSVDEQGQVIVTTQEEIDAYFIIKAIVRDIIEVKRVTMRDAQSYCSILIDDNNRKLLCRLRFNTSQKYLSVLNEDKSEERLPIGSLDDIYKYADRLKQAASKYVTNASPASVG